MLNKSLDVVLVPKLPLGKRVNQAPGHPVPVGEIQLLKQLVSLLAVLALAVGTHAQEGNAGLGARIVDAARQQIGVTKAYDPNYVAISYPGGDVPLNTGVCSDVVVRALRKLGLDLQTEVHEDMKRHFSAYPQKWGLKAPDKNIDHRRVPNLMRYFERHHIVMEEKLKMPETYRPGDIVAWDLGGGVLHIGVVSDRVAVRTPLIIHNIGSGAKEEDILFKYSVIGHYRVKEGFKPSGGASEPRPAGLTTNQSPLTARPRQ